MVFGVQYTPWRQGLHSTLTSSFFPSNALLPLITGLIYILSLADLMLTSTLSVCSLAAWISFYPPIASYP